jgi:hypothetical protein
MKSVYIIGPHAFVAHPTLRGLWLRTHVSVAHVACSYCNAQRGEPCRGVRGLWLSATHVKRRLAMKRQLL